MTYWSFAVAAALVAGALTLVAALATGFRVPMPHLRRRPLVKQDAEPVRIALHLGTATPRAGGFSPRRIGL